MKHKITTYRDAIEYLYGLQKYGIKFGLSKTSNIMKALGNPHRRRRYIHIAGTNGKGSVSAMVESILMKAGLKVGFYSSPHLVRFTERFRINRKEITRKDTIELVNELRGVINPSEPPTFFEATTAMALSWFAKKETDIAIMEVGMGGRLDATNVIRPVVSVITNISLEHQAFLGNRLMDIAGEKAGIIKRGIDLVTAATQPTVIDLFKETCRARKAGFMRVDRDFRYRLEGHELSYFGIKHRLSGLRPGLAGRFQARNTALALAVIETLEKKGYRISEGNIRDGLSDLAWPGRMQIMSRAPLVIVDGAHNPAAVRGLADSISGGFSFDRMIAVIGIMGDKDIKSIIRLISPVADYIICTRPDYYRAADPGLIMGAVAGLGRKGEAIDSLSRAIDKAKAVASARDLILITGSLFTVGEALTILDPIKYTPDPV